MRGIIFGVSTELTDADIVSETGALAARRLTRRVEGENKPTGNVVISFPETLPSSSILCVHRLPEVQGKALHTSTDEVPEVSGIWPHRCQL